MILLNFKYFIFDFDGTIAQSGMGITRSAAYAIEQMGYPALTDEQLRKFVGPPLHDSFCKLCGMSEDEATEAVRQYRVRYNDIGKFEADIYPGITQMLKALKQAGAWVAVASGKPKEFLVQIIEHFGLTPYFDAVTGPDLQNRSSDKTQQVIEAMPEGANFAEACMVGDRCFDVDAGKNLGMHTVAVEYGYGNREEFERSGADCICATVADLSAHLLGETPIARGRMITFEGTDGCGKSTQQKKIGEWLQSRGYEVVTTREPGGCPISEKIRELLLSLDSKGMSAECEALLYAASRVEHVKEVILPALNCGKIVLCDRFLDSSIAYQAYGRELGEDFIRLINKKASEAVTPDCTLQFDIRREMAKTRMAAGAPLDRLESEQEDFFTRVAEGYDRIAAAEPERIHRIDSGRTIDEVFADVLPIIRSILEKD